MAELSDWFRVKIILNNYFADHKSKAYVSVNRQWKNVRQFHKHLEEIFDVSKFILTTADDIYLPGKFCLLCFVTFRGGGGVFSSFHFECSLLLHFSSEREYQHHKSRRYNCVSTDAKTCVNSMSTTTIAINSFVVSISLSLSLFPHSVIPKDKTRTTSASIAAPDGVGLSGLGSKATQDLFREMRGPKDDFVFVTPKSVQSRKSAGGNAGTASGESFISCSCSFETASISTSEDTTANKRKRVRKRKKKSVAIENANTSEAADETTVPIRPNPFKNEPIVEKSNNHVRYVCSNVFYDRCISNFIYRYLYFVLPKLKHVRPIQFFFFNQILFHSRLRYSINMNMFH